MENCMNCGHDCHCGGDCMQDYDGNGEIKCCGHCRHEEKDKIWSLLKVEKNTGITLTETRAMYPAASICGWYFSHPKSRYFSVSNIGL